MATDTMIKAYLQQIGRYPLLTADEEIQLGRRVAKAMELQGLKRELTQLEKRDLRRGMQARDKFVSSNLRLVVNIARRYQYNRKSLEFMDLVQEGTFGLIRAVEKFDHTRGYKFSTYAYWWVRQGIQRAIACSDSLIRIPVLMQEKLLRMRLVIEELSHKLKRAPTVVEIAEALEISVDDLMLLKNRTMDAVSLDKSPVGCSDDVSIIDTIADPSSYLDSDESLNTQFEIEKLMAVMDLYLDTQAKYVLLARHADVPMTWRELSDRQGVSRESLQKVEEKALQRCRALMRVSATA